MKKQIEEINKEDVEGYEKLVNFTKKIFDKGFTELADIPFDKPFVVAAAAPQVSGGVFPVARIFLAVGSGERSGGE